MKKILLVDDDIGIGEVVKLILTEKGYDVHVHQTGLRVPELVKDFAPNLILLDIGLPGKLGTTICKELKEISNLPPILLFSAHSNEKASKAWCTPDGFIEKPFDVSHLLNTISAHIN